MLHINPNVAAQTLEYRQVRPDMTAFSSPAQPDLTMRVLHCSQQVKRRCRWLVSFAEEELAHMASRSEDPFEGQHIDANMLGGRPDMSTPGQHCLCASGRPILSGHRQGDSHIIFHLASPLLGLLTRR